MSSSHFIEETAAKAESLHCLAFAAGFFFSFRLVFPLLSIQLAGLEPSTGSAIVIGIDLLLFGLICFDGSVPPGTVFRRMMRGSGFRWAFAFLLLSLCSLLWSDTSSVANSMAYWTGLAADVGIVSLLLCRESADAEAHSLLKGFVWSACCVAAIAWILPTPADLRLGDDLYFNANEIGNTCAFAVFFAQYLMRRNHGKWGIAMLFLTVTLIRSLSKTTLVAFLISEAVLLCSDRFISRKTRIMLIFLAVILIMAFWGLFEAYYDVYTTAGNQAETLTGRTAIWLYVLNATFDHSWTPWIGHGFDAWWKVVPPFGGEQFEARHAENEVLQQFYAYGVVGVVTLAGLYGSLYRQLRKLRQEPTRPLLLSFLLFIVIRGIAEAEAFDLLLPLWCVVLISAIAEEQQARWSLPQAAVAP